MARHSAGGARGQGRRRGSWLSTLLIIVGLILLAIAGGMWGMAQWRYHEQRVINEKLSAYATPPASEDDDEAEGPKAPEVDWEGLKAINEDIVGWIQVPGTDINYPVYQAEDNERYLRHSATGEWSVGGQLFMDYANTAPGMVDEITMIYGHHLLDGTMFKLIAEMDQQDRFNEIDTVWYLTEKAAYECEPLMVYYVHETDATARTFTFASDADFRTFVNVNCGNAVVKRDDAQKILASCDHLLCLVTCNYYDEYEGHGRTVVACVPKAEAKAALGE